MHCHYPLVVAVVAACWQVTLATQHSETWGEEPDQEDIDNGQCIPIKCDLGVPPIECTRLCALRKYVPICKSPGDFCLCQHLVGNKVELVSPDEVEDQPPDPSESEEGTPKTYTFSVLTVFVPLRNFFSGEQFKQPPTQEPFVVNVHEGRLFWDFRYILTGLFLIMVGLVVFELILCRIQAIQSKHADHSEPKWKVMNV